MVTFLHRANVQFNLPVFGGSLSMISISVLALAVGMRALPLLDNRLISTRNISLSSLILSSTMSMEACWDCCSPVDKTSGRFTTLWKSSPAVRRERHHHLLARVYAARFQTRVALLLCSNNCILQNKCQPITLKTFAMMGMKGFSCHQGTKVKVKGQWGLILLPTKIMIPSKLALCVSNTFKVW